MCGSATRKGYLRAPEASPSFPGEGPFAASRSEAVKLPGSGLVWFLVIDMSDLLLDGMLDWEAWPFDV